MASTIPYEQLRPILKDADAAFLITCAATALVLYEHAITFGLEVQQIWQRNISGAAILFILTRYITLINRILVTISLTSIRSLESCQALSWAQAVTTSVLIVVMSAIAAIRVYALWNRDIRLFALVMLAGIFPALTNLFIRSVSTVYVLPTDLYSCQVAPTAMSAAGYAALSIATRIVSILADGLVVVLTWVKTYRVFILTRGVRVRSNYAALILRDGTLYFLAVCVLNLIAIVYLMNVGANLLNDMIVTLSSLLMARFLLNLRDRRNKVEDHTFGMTPTSLTPSSRPYTSVPFTTTMVDSMGGVVGADDDDDDDEDDEDARPEKLRKVDDEEIWSGVPRPISPSRDDKGVLVLGEKEAVWV